MDSSTDSIVTNVYRNWCMKEFLAELLGTFVLMIINNGIIAVFILLKPVTVDTLAMAYVAGIGAMIGIMLSTPVSGGHINPAVTVAFAITKRHQWSKVPHYLLAQYVGSFLSQVVLYFLYLDAFNNFDGGVRSAFGSPKSTGKIFATYPPQGISLMTAFFDEVFGTMMLLLGVLAIIDPRGMKIPSHLHPFFISLWIAGMCTALGYNSGAILNPARDVAPRLFTALIGYGWSVFTPLHGHYWYMAGLIGPHLGAVFGCCVYDFVIGSALDKKSIIDAKKSEEDDLDHSFGINKKSQHSHQGYLQSGSRRPPSYSPTTKLNQYHEGFSGHHHGTLPSSVNVDMNGNPTINNNNNNDHFYYKIDHHHGFSSSRKESFPRSRSKSISNGAGGTSVVDGGSDFKTVM